MRTSILSAAILLAVIVSLPVFGQIYAPEGLNMPGGWSTNVGGSWQNPPSNLAFAGILQPGGRHLLDTTLGTWRYRTIISVQSSGGDITGGTYQWLYTSSSFGNPWGNRWRGGTVIMNTLQNYAYQGSSDSNIVTVTNGNYYTVNWKDAGYNPTQAIWMETSGEPVTIPTVTQSPLPGSVTSADSVTVTVTISGLKSLEENVYVRYSTSPVFATSFLVPVSFTGTTGTAVIPAQAGGSTIRYYVLSTTATNPASDFDMYTIHHNNNNKANYVYSVSAANYTIEASAGAGGSITPSGNIVVLPGADTTFIITPNVGFFVDSVIVDGIKVDSTTSYTFTNVSANHSIRAVFAYNVNVTFQANMSVKMLEGNFRPDLGDVVTVRGSFNDWGDTNGNPDTLTDGNNDSVYTKTIALKSNGGIEFKFWKTLRGGQDWEGGNNRAAFIGGADTTLPALYYNNELPPNPPVDVTFHVNMKIKMQERMFRPDSGDYVTVRGSFNDWGNSGNLDTLYDGNGDSIYTRTRPIPSGNTIEYKFWKSDRGGYGYEGQIGNRSFEVPGGNAELPVVYFDNDSVLGVGVDYAGGWNMVSNPVLATNDSVKNLYPASVFPYAFIFVPGSGYQQRYTMPNGPGVWAKYPGIGTAKVPGNYIFADSIDVVAGWNMVGSISLPVDSGSVFTIPSGIRSTVFYGYNGGYGTGADTIFPGKGYWVKANAPGKIVLINEGPPAGRPLVPGLVRRPFGHLNSLTITDSRGGGQTLYFGADASLSANYFEMPPPAPEGAFDARFESDRAVELFDAAGATQLPVRVHSTAYPLTLSWSIVDDGGRVLVLKDNSGVRPMTGSGSVQVTDPAVNRFVIQAGAAELPQEFALSQNYPNPFNPTTTIRYALPVDARVSVRVFDVLGRKVTTLLDDVQSAGYNAVEWNGTNGAGVASATGVYFYRIDATPVNGGAAFTSVKKMMVVK